MITVVLPAHDEEHSVAETVGEIRAVLEGAGMEGYEVLVVDDGSTDATADLAHRAGARVIRHPANAGYGRSLKDGLLAAANDTVVICDADGTYPAASILDLIAEYEKGFDMVVGARSGYRDSFFKAPLRKVLRWLVEYTAGCKVPDVNSGLRVFSRAAVVPYFKTLCDTFSFTTSLTLAYLMTGRFVSYRPVPYRARKGETKVRLLRDSLRTLQYIVQAIVYYNPLKIFILFSGACAVFAGFGFLASAVLGLQSGFLLGVGGLLVALVVFSLGLLADLLRQILTK